MANKKELITEIAKETGFLKREVTSIVDLFIDKMTNGLLEDGSVRISNFGTFKVVERAARKGHNPQTNKPIDIPASKAVKFKSSSALKEKL